MDFVGFAGRKPHVRLFRIMEFGFRVFPLIGGKCGLGRQSSLPLLVLPAYGLAQPEMCTAAELEEYPAAGFGLQNIDRSNGVLLRKEP